MLFNSLDFLIFFILVLSIYFLVPVRIKWLILLIASYFFYGYSNPVYLVYLIIPTVFVYFFTRVLHAIGIKRQKKIFLWLGLLSGLSLLIIFKYADFAGSTMHSLLGIFKKNPSAYNPLNFILPLGISFYSFKLASYVMDVYNEKLKPETHFGYFALYVSFFPQLLAGPIDRAINLIPQLKKKVNLDYQRVTSGLKLIMWGFFKKIVIADHLATTVNRVYDNVYSYEGLPLLTVVFFYSIQIYCDFSGYSDIAIGIARILGFKSMINFASPYFSQDIKQFWNKWHISLSTWLRDYLFLPIAYAIMRKIPSATFMRVKVETWGLYSGYVCYHVPGRLMAWCQLDFCPLGSYPWILFNRISYYQKIKKKNRENHQIK